MDASTVIDMLEAMDGRDAVSQMNVRVAYALYGALIMDADDGENRVARMAHDLGVSPKTIYAWTANRATPPVRALTYCVDRWGSAGCLAALLPDPNQLLSPANSILETAWILRKAARP